MLPNELYTALKYGTDAHTRLARQITSRLQLSYDAMSNRYSKLAENEEQFHAYIPETEADAERRQGRDVNGVPSYRTIEIPYSYAMALTAHTYFTTVFLSRSPVLQYLGRHGETQMQEQAVEAVMDYQTSCSRSTVPLFIWLLDPAKQGFGVVGSYWEKRTITRRKFVDVPVTFLGRPIEGKFQREQVLEEKVIYEGNRTYNVRGQDFFPDPRVTMRNFQRGEFCARYVEVPWHDVLQGAADGKYFNVEFLRQQTKSSPGIESGVIPRDEGGAVSELPGTFGYTIDSALPAAYIKGHEIYVRLIPKLWRVGAEGRPEVWVFTISSNGIIFGATPLEDPTDEFPFDLIEAEVEGYNLFAKSTMERVKPLNDTITWLLNAHFYNVRQTLNNQFVFDPRAVYSEDVENPMPGRGIRLKPEAMGRDIRTIFQQLQVSDITRGHMTDARTVEELFQKVLGINDAIMGVLDPGGRKTATEVRTSSSFGTNRLKTQCEYMSAMGFSPYGQRLLMRTQQNYTTERKHRIVGDLAQYATQFVNVTPQDLEGFFDYVAVDGTLPVDRYAQANLWKELMAGMANFPQIMQTYDVAKIFGWVAQLGGVKNLSQFRLEVRPDGALQQQAAAGNVIPLPAPNRMDMSRVIEPRQIPGMGATG